MKTFILAGLCLIAFVELLPCGESFDMPTESGEQFVPSGAKLAIAFDRKEYMLGENVLLQFSLENTGKKPFEANFGGDYRGADRYLRFKVTAMDEHGHLVPEADPNPNYFGGLSRSSKVMAGEKLVISLPLMRYCQIDEPGRYTIRATHDLGWQAGVAKIPVAETSITFRMPDANEAEQIVCQMEKLPDVERSEEFGKKSADFADFRCLRYSVYLEPLLRRAKAGDMRALEGIGYSPSPEAASALIDLANQPDRKVSTDAALYLCERLPNRKVQVKLPPHHSFKLHNDAVRERLGSHGWVASLTDKVRELAHKVLVSPDVDGVRCGAFMIEAIGTPEDAPALFSALNQAAELPVAINARRLPTDDILDFPDPLPELLRAALTLYERGCDPEKYLSGHGQLLAYFSHWQKESPSRPQEWLELVDVFGQDATYPVREAALKSIPLPLPDSCIKFVNRGFDDQDLGVCMAACTIAGKSGRKEFLKRLIQIIATENNEWVLRAASDSALALGGGHDLLATWADRVGDQDIYDVALDYLQTVLEGLPGGYSGRTDLTRAERLAIRDAWKRFLTDHAEEIRSGKKFKYSASAVSSKLFGRARTWILPNGNEWPALQ